MKSRYNNHTSVPKEVLGKHPKSRQINYHLQHAGFSLSLPHSVCVYVMERWFSCVSHSYRSIYSWTCSGHNVYTGLNYMYKSVLSHTLLSELLSSTPRPNISDLNCFSSFYNRIISRSLCSLANNPVSNFPKKKGIQCQTHKKKKVNIELGFYNKSFTFITTLMKFREMIIESKREIIHCVFIST